jgi:hypothetical protein
MGISHTAKSWKTTSYDDLRSISRDLTQATDVEKITVKYSNEASAKEG